MILGFRNRETARIWSGERSRRLPSWIQRASVRKLRLLDLASSLRDLQQPPGNRLEELSGDRAGQYSLRINDQWRVCFRWTDRGATDVEIVDYHS